MVKPLHQSSFFSGLLDQLNQGIIVVETEGKIVYNNRTAEQLLAVPEGQLTHTRLSDYFSDINDLLKAVAPDRPASREYALSEQDGKATWVDVQISFYQNAGSMPNGFLVSIKDITETRLIAASRNRYLEMLRIAVETGGLGIWELKLDDNQLIWNDAQLNIYGISRERFNQDYNYWKSLVHPEDAEYAENEINKVLQGEEVFNVSYRIIRPDNNLRFIHASSRPVYDSEGNMVKLIGVNIDVTEFRIQEQRLLERNNELLKLNNELDYFVYNTSHNIRAPLTSVFGVLQLLDEDISEQERRHYHSMIKEAIANLDSTVHDITEYSRNSRVKVKIEEVQLLPLLNEVYNKVIHTELINNVSIYFNLPENFTFFSDAYRLNVIFTNLITNAIRYSDSSREESWVKVSLEHQDNEHFMIAVADNGIGMEAGIQDKVFNMFYRGTNHSTGTGLGLYIVMEVLGKLRGSVEFSSEKGKGTRFLVTLPFYPEK